MHVAISLVHTEDTSFGLFFMAQGGVVKCHSVAFESSSCHSQDGVLLLKLLLVLYRAFSHPGGNLSSAANQLRLPV